MSKGHSSLDSPSTRSAAPDAQAQDRVVPDDRKAQERRRLAAALRENLGRRKTQSRERRAAPPRTEDA